MKNVKIEFEEIALENQNITVIYNLNEWLYPILNNNKGKLKQDLKQITIKKLKKCSNVNILRSSIFELKCLFEFWVQISLFRSFTERLLLN